MWSSKNRIDGWAAGEWMGTASEGLVFPCRDDVGLPLHPEVQGLLTPGSWQSNCKFKTLTMEKQDMAIMMRKKRGN